MPKCPKCNSEWPDDMAFCGKCGSSLTAKAPTPAARLRTRERRQAVVLFADIQGYTKLAADLGDPEVLHDAVEPIYHLMEDAVKLHGGMVASFIGDCAMALFGVPKAHENDEARAIRCALEMHGRMAEYPEVHGRKLSLTIGINAGLVVAGEIGAAEKFDFDALGDAVNVAARLQDKADAGQVFVSGRIYRRVRPQFEWEPVGPFELKNVPRPVPAYNVLKERDPAETMRFTGARMAVLCGRDAEMKKIAELLEKVASGQGQVLGITGEAGVGKSRLVYELRNRAEDLGFRTLIGRTLSYGQNMPLWPVKEILRQYAGLKKHEEKEFAQERIRETFSFAWDDGEISEIRVTTLGWFLGYAFKDSATEKLEGKAKQNLLEVALNDFFLALANVGAQHAAPDIVGAQRAVPLQPLVLVLEDMHWSGPTTKDWVVQFSRLIKNKPVLVVLAYRSGFEYDWAGEPLITFSEIALEPIETASIGDMVSSVLAVEKAPGELARFVADKSQGNPFFAEEIVRHLLENKIAVREMSLADGTTSINITKPLDKVDIPASVQALIMSRIDILEAGMRRTLQEASVIGQSFLEKILAEISAAKERLNEHLNNLADFEIIHKQSRILEIEYVFRHILARDAVYETLLKKRRQELHKEIAEAIERLFPDKLEDFYSLLAHHLEFSGDTARAGHYLYEEGKRLKEAGDLKSAHGVLTDAANLGAQRAVPLQAADAGAAECADIILDLAGVTLDVESPAAAQEVLKRLPDSVTNEQTARRSIVEGGILDRLGKYKEAESEYKSALDVGAGLRPAPTTDAAAIRKLRRTAMSGLGGIQWRTGNLDGAEAHFRKCLESSLDDNDKRAEGVALNNIGLVHHNRGDLDRAMEYYEKALEMYRAISDRHGEGRVLNNIGHLCDVRGDLDRAMTYLGMSLKIKCAIGDRLGEAITLGNIGLVYQKRGDLGRALEYQEKSLETRRTLGDRQGEALALVGIGIVYGRRRDFDRALECHDKAIEIFGAIGDRKGEAIALGNIGLVSRDRGDLECALEYFEKTLEIDHAIGNRGGEALSLTNIGHVHRKCGDLDRALKYFEKGLEIKRAIGDKRGEATTLSDIGDISLEKGNIDETGEHCETGIAIAKEIGANDIAAQFQLTLSEIERDSGNYAAAEEILGEAIETLNKLGMKGELFSAYLQSAEQALERIVTTDVGAQHAVPLQKAKSAIQEAESLLPEIKDDPSLRDYHQTRGKLLAALQKSKSGNGRQECLPHTYQEANAAFKTALEYAAKCAEPTNNNLYREYGKFLSGIWDKEYGIRDKAELRDKGQGIGDKEEKEIKEEARKYLEKAKEIYEYRVAHGARRKELDEVNELLQNLESDD